MLTLPGNTQAVDFADPAIFAKGIHGDEGKANVVQEIFGGEPVLRINIPKSSGTEPGAWRIGLSRAFTKNGQGFGVGSEFWVVYDIFMGPGYLTPSNGGGGKKQSIISQYLPESPDSSSSHTDIEIVMHQMDGDEYIGAYHDPDSAAFFIPKGGDFVLQSAVPTCLYSNKAGCIKNVEGQWMTYCQRVKVGKFNGSTGNEFEALVAFPGDSDWRPVFNNKNFALGSEGPYSGMFLTGYDTGRTSGKLDTFVRHRHLAVFTQRPSLASIR